MAKPVPKKRTSSKADSTTPATTGKKTRAAQKKTTVRPAARGKKGKKGDDEPEDPDDGGDDSDAEKDEDDEGSVKMKWDGLVKPVLDIISQNQDIRQGLFPTGPQVSSAQGGGKKKVHWLWQVCLQLFTGHAVYGDAFAAAVNGTAKDHKPWTDKLRNKLKKMTKDVNGYMEEMGSTGMGIHQEEDIDIESGSTLANKWLEIKAECPWFFEMKALIAECPNAVPTGLGNSQSMIDTSVLQLPALTPPPAIITSDPGVAHNEDATGEAASAEQDGDGDDRGETATTSSESSSLKRKAERRESAGGKKKNKFTSELAAVAETEANLAKARCDAQALIKVEATKAAIAAKVALEKSKNEATTAKLAMKKEIRLAKMKYKHELEMARILGKPTVPSTSQAPQTVNDRSSYAPATSQISQPINDGAHYTPEHQPATHQNHFFPSSPSMTSSFGDMTPFSTASDGLDLSIEHMSDFLPYNDVNKQ